MGLSHSAEEKKILLKAKHISEEIIARTQRKHQRLRPLIAPIPASLRKLILNASACELTSLLDNNQATSLQILLVFIDRTATLGIANHYVMDELFEQAVLLAKHCDETRKLYPGRKCWRLGDDLANTFPPFFGVPTSVKETILYAGRITYVGHVNVVNPIPDEQPLFVELLFRMGFIPFVRSTVPPSCKIIETVSNFFPHARNGWNGDRSCGGSSGGEGGLIGSGCSPIGFGTDIGGSARVPAQWNGLCSIKPAFRYTAQGNAYYGKYAAGAPTKSQICPMAHSVEDLLVFCQYMFDPTNYGYLSPRIRDIHLQQVPFCQQSFKEVKKLRIGYFSGVKGWYGCSPAHERVLKSCVAQLERNGHQVKPITPPGLEQIFLYFLRIYTSDNTLSVLDELRQKEPPIKEYKLFYLIAKIPWLIRYIIAWLLRKSQPRISKIILSSKPMKNNVEAVHFIYDHVKVKQQELFKYMAEEGVDIWVTPGFPLPAIAHGTIGNFTPVIGHTAVWNALHYPAGVIPISVVRNDELTFTDGINDKITQSMKSSLEQAQGLPVGLQVISFPNKEEQILAIMNELQQAFSFRKHHVCPATIE